MSETPLIEIAHARSNHEFLNYRTVPFNRTLFIKNCTLWTYKLLYYWKQPNFSPNLHLQFNQRCLRPHWFMVFFEYPHEFETNFEKIFRTWLGPYSADKWKQTSGGKSHATIYLKATSMRCRLTKLGFVNMKTYMKIFRIYCVHTNA